MSTPKDGAGGGGVFTKLSNRMKGLFSSSSSEPEMIISKPTGMMYECMLPCTKADLCQFISVVSIVTHVVFPLLCPPIV